MGIEIKSRVINGSEYAVQTHGALKGRKVLLRLTRIAGTTLVGLDKNNLPAAVGRLVGALDDTDLEFFCDEFAAKSTVTIASAKIDLTKVFDVHFADNYLAMCQWLAFCIEANFASFFRDAAKALGELGEEALVKAAAKKAAEST